MSEVAAMLAVDRHVGCCVPTAQAGGRLVGAFILPAVLRVNPGTFRGFPA